ncbi:MAG: serine/threonine protein kinase, partial [Phycisphaerales bacterium]|nr:serine/threonine protein kinase [Phycisphaerales bacterium]
VERATRRKVAIKHIIRRTAADDKFVAQAETEFAVSQAIDHPVLRKCHEIVRIRKWLKVSELFLIMEYVEGETLEQLCPDRMADIVALFIKVADGLNAMHRAGYAHCDVKPINILLMENHEPKIIDFGQSCALGTVKERIQGTPDYIAPEQLERKPIDHRTDIYNLGATMYWVVTGKAFATKMQVAPVGTKKIEVDARRGSEPPHELNPKVPLALSSLILECCEEGPEARPRDMKQVIARLEVAQHLSERNEEKLPRPVRPAPDRTEPE